MVLVTAAEAVAPRRDLPTAARYMYTLPVSMYIVGIILVGICIDYTDAQLPHSHINDGTVSENMTTASSSPFVIVIKAAGIHVLPGFLNAAFMFSALTAA